MHTWETIFSDCMKWTHTDRIACTKLFVCIEYEYVTYPVHCEHNSKPIPYNLPSKIYSTCQTHTLNSPAATIITITALSYNDSRQIEINNSVFDWIIAQKSSTIFNLLFMCIYLYVRSYTKMGITVVFFCIAWDLICIHHLDLYHPYFVIIRQKTICYGTFECMYVFFQSNEWILIFLNYKKYMVEKNGLSQTIKTL